MILGFTGAQTGMAHEQRISVDSFFANTPVSALHHGGCIGADFDAHVIASEIGLDIVIHPPIDTKKIAQDLDGPTVIDVRKPRDYLARNQDIVDDCEHLLAAPSGKERVRSGTWATVRRARKAGKPITIIYPDGTIERENQ